MSLLQASKKAIQDSVPAAEAFFGPLAWIERLIAFLSRWLNNLGMVFLTILMLVITLDVILRWTVNKPIRGVNELAEFSMLLLIFLTIGFTQVMKGNISVDILFLKFPRKMQAVAEIFTYLLSLGISVLLVWQAMTYNNYLSNINRVSVILKIPVAPIQTVMVVGFSLLCIVFLLQLIASVRKAVQK